MPVATDSAPKIMWLLQAKRYINGEGKIRCKEDHLPSPHRYAVSIPHSGNASAYKVTDCIPDSLAHSHEAEIIRMLPSPIQSGNYNVDAR